MKKIATLLGAVLLAGTAFTASVRAADELTITSWGGAYQESQRKAFFEPFIAAGNKITEAEYNGEIAKIRAMVEAGAVSWDVVDVDTQTALAGCAEGTFETIDWAKLGLDRSKFIGGDVTDCAVPNILYSTVAAYDTSKTAAPAGPVRSPLRHDQVSRQARPAEEPLRQSRVGADGGWRGPGRCLQGAGHG